MNKPFFPSTVVVEPTNKCNLGCEFCEANCTVNKHLAKREITPDELETMLEKIKHHIVNVVFQGDCEPTLNKYLPDLAKIASRYTSSIALVTNGTRLREDYVKQLIASGINWFSLSIDDHRPDVFNNIRLRADLNRILGYLERLIELRNSENPDLHVVIHKIVFPNDTVESIKTFVRMFYLDYGVNQITFAPLVEAGNVKCPNWLVLRNQVESELFSEGVYINLREFGSYPYKTLHKYCGTNLLFIDHQGNLSPCTLHVRQGRNFGNLIHESLEDIAENPRFKEYHGFWQSKQYWKPLPSHCQDCFLLKGHYHRYTLNEGHEKGLHFSRHKLLPVLSP